MTTDPRILLVRVGAIGDIVFASPLVATFRRAYPNAHIAWLAKPECRSLLEHHPDLDEVITWPENEWRDLWRKRRLGALAREITGFAKLLRIAFALPNNGDTYWDSSPKAPEICRRTGSYRPFVDGKPTELSIFVSDFSWPRPEILLYKTCLVRRGLAANTARHPLTDWVCRRQGHELWPVTARFI